MKEPKNVTRKIIAELPWPANLVDACNSWLPFREPVEMPHNPTEREVEYVMEQVLTTSQQQVVYIMFRDGGRLCDAAEALGVSNERARQLRNSAVSHLNGCKLLSEITNKTLDGYLNERKFRIETAKNMAAEAGYTYTDADCQTSIEQFHELVSALPSLRSDMVYTIADLLAWYYLDSEDPAVQGRYNARTRQTVCRVLAKLGHLNSEMKRLAVDETGLSTAAKNGLMSCFGHVPNLWEIAVAGVRKVYYAPGIGCKVFMEIADFMAQHHLDRHKGYAWPSSGDIKAYGKDRLYREIGSRLDMTGGPRVPLRLNAIRAGEERLCHLYPSMLEPGDTVFYRSNPRVIRDIVWDKTSTLSYIISNNGNKYVLADLQ